MQKSSVTLLTIALFAGLFSASAEEAKSNSVISHTGEIGELIVLRNDVVYWLSTGDEVFTDDILRAQAAETATISYNDCTLTLPAKQDVQLNDEFCTIATAETPSMAMIASQGGTPTATGAITTAANAPLIVGGIVLSAGGIVAATNGGNGGTGSLASAAAGAPQATTVSGS